MTVQKNAIYNENDCQLVCEGDWDLGHFTHIKSILNSIVWPDAGEITISGKDIKKMDSSGAWLLLFIKEKLEEKNLTVHFQNFTEEQKSLLKIVKNKLKDQTGLPTVTQLSWLATVGKTAIRQWKELLSYLSFIGNLCLEAGRLIPQPKHWRFGSLSSVIYRNGYQALPIIALLSFMIGVVITYQLGLQLRSYGANIYIIDLLGLSIFREFSPLLTAIMVAGRTGSSYTAQLGMMTINQEIDALDTMGVTPGELLILPRILGLFIVLPLLTMWADVFGLIGGIMMANNMLNITWHDFITRFPNVIPLRAFIIGIGKAPVFALIIASIGCYQGMSVQRNADSVGKNTTRSVVLAIFFIIVTDAIFSIIFSKLKL